VQPVGDDYNIFYHSSFFIIMFIGFVFSEKREKVIYKGRWRYFTLSERRDKVEISLNICYWGEKKSPRYYLRIYEIGGLNYYYYIFFFVLISAAVCDGAQLFKCCSQECQFAFQECHLMTFICTAPRTFLDT